MWRKIAIILPAFVLAFGILFTSVLRTASVKYDFGSTTHVSDGAVLGDSDVNIEYNLAYHGRVLPDHPLWPVKALRDRIWLIITTNPTRKAELKLLFADKRVSASKVLFEKDKPELGFSTLEKAEKYLAEASELEKENREKGLETTEFLMRLSYAALKHYQITEEILAIAPEDAKPKIIEVQKYAKDTYNAAKSGLGEEGVAACENPFDWD
jgi:hypothetical protein